LKHTVDGCEILHHLGWLKPKQNHGIFTIVFNWCRISLAYPQYYSTTGR